MIGADAKDIVFTSGATESNNIAVKGVAHFYQERKKHIITTQIVSFFKIYFSLKNHVYQYFIEKNIHDYLFIKYSYSTLCLHACMYQVYQKGRIGQIFSEIHLRSISK